MPSPQVDIIFRGVREGFDPADVKKKFAILFKLNAVKVERIFKSRKVTLKTAVDATIAAKYIRKLASIGVAADTVELISPVISPASNAIYIPDRGIESVDSYAMHQPVDFLYGTNIRRIPFVFNGTGAEYCKIWLVNILATIFSAGLLYPWARMRSLRYLYQSTSLDKHEFFYSPRSQRFLMFQLLFMAYALGLVYLFYCGLILISTAGALLLVLLLPFYWLKHLEMQCRQSSYHHLTFKYHASVRDAYLIFLVYPALGILTLGLLAPFAAFKIQQFAMRTKTIAAQEFLFNTSVLAYLFLLPSLIITEVLTFSIIHWRVVFPVWMLIFVISFMWIVLVAQIGRAHV